MTSVLRLFRDIASESYNDEGYASNTSLEQIDVEAIVCNIYRRFEHKAAIDPSLPKLIRKAHCNVLKDWLMHLPGNYSCLDASRPWLIYWILHSLWLLKKLPDAETLSKVVNFLKQCQHKDGGYGGGPMQHSHLGTTYAAVNALSIIGTDEAYDSIDRSSLQTFLWTLRDVDGSFALHNGGEQDIRDNKELIETVLFNQGALQEYIIVCCQSPEGGLIDKPGKPRDIYHTCYTLSGLSVAQHGTGTGESLVIGASETELNRVHPLHNIAPHMVYNAVHYFIRHPPPVKDDN
ncbi:protein farnesyltransferase subunit beta isoform X3 [Pieris brassicae]|uniref:protein farnesyltransferase subunit beta isoform X3 n=1 Tax=Pieris brassicae TaxID=7116 RepID=UPI001E65E2FF|nr:protein farnesyltransferase subunit beta isoform X3 [Pieris brassicae]